MKINYTGDYLGKQGQGSGEGSAGAWGTQFKGASPLHNHLQRCARHRGSAQSGPEPTEVSSSGSFSDLCAIEVPTEKGLATESLANLRRALAGGKLSQK